MAKIISCEEIGEFDTYDLEVDHPDHQYYLSNGVLTSNSHAIAYSIISVQTAWLKCHHPTEFMCATLNLTDPNSDGAQEYLTECKNLGIQVTPPDINKGAEAYKVIGDKTIATGFSAVKGLGPAAISELVKMQPFDNFCDFLLKGNQILCVDDAGVETVTPSLDWVGTGTALPKSCKIESKAFIGKSAIQSLASAGALDSFGRARKDIYDNFDSYRTKVKNAIKKGKVITDADLGKSEEEWSRKEILFNEREVMGRTISGSAHEMFEGFFRNKSISMKLSELKTLRPGSKIRVDAVIRSKIKEFKIKNGPKTGKKFAKYAIEDLFGSTAEITLWADDYEKYIHLFKDGIPFKALCKVDEYMGEKSLSLSELIEIFGVK